MGTAVAPSQTPSEDSFKGHSSDAAVARQGTSPGSGPSQAADAQAPADRASEASSDRASDKASDRASDTASDRASDQASQTASDKVSDRASGTAPDRASERATDRASDKGTQVLSSPAGDQQTSDPQAFSLPVVGSDDTASVQQADSAKAQQAGMQAPSPDSQRQPISTEASLSQRGESESLSQKSLHTSGQVLPSLTGAQADGTAASVAAPQESGLFKEPHSAPEATTSRDQQLQAAALEGTAASSQAAVNAGLSLPTPRSGAEQRHLSLKVWLGCMFSPSGVCLAVLSSCILL